MPIDHHFYSFLLGVGGGGKSFPPNPGKGSALSPTEVTGALHENKDLPTEIQLEPCIARGPNLMSLFNFDLWSAQSKLSLN